jgi:hypothetical protein
MILIEALLDMSCFLKTVAGQLGGDGDSYVRFSLLMSASLNGK